MRRCCTDGLLLFRRKVRVHTGKRKEWRNNEDGVRERKRLVIGRASTYRNLMAALEEAEPGWCSTVLGGFQGLPLPGTVVSVLWKLREDVDMALEFFEWAGRRNGFHHSPYTLNAVIEVLVRAKRIEEAWLLVKDRKFKADQRTCRLLVEGFCSASQAEKAIGVLGEMEASGVKPPRESQVRVLESLLQAGKFVDNVDGLWKAIGGRRTDLLIWLCKARRLDDALLWLEKGITNASSFEVLGYNVLLDALCKSKRVEEARKVFYELLARESPADLFTYTALIDGLTKEGKLDEAQLVFRKMLVHGCVPDTVTIGALIHGLCKARKIWEAVDLFKKVDGSGCSLDVLVYNALILAHCRLQRVETGLDLFRYMKSRGCEPDVVTYNMLADGLGKSGQVSEAFYCLRDMIEVGCEPTIYTINALVAGHCKTEDIDEGVQLVERVVNMGIEPGIVARNLVMDGLCRRGRVVEALKILRNLVESTSSCRPSIISYNIVINGLCKAGMLSPACELFHEILGRGPGACRPNVITYNTLIHGLCKGMRMDDARAYFSLMNGTLAAAGNQNVAANGAEKEEQSLQPGVSRGCCSCSTQAQESQGKNTEAVVQNWERPERNSAAGVDAAEQEIFDTGVVAPNLITYTTLVRGYCEALNWDEACSLLEEMQRRGYTPGVALYVTIVEGLCRDGRVGDASGLLEKIVKWNDSADASAAVIEILVKWLGPDEVHSYVGVVRTKYDGIS